jgi:hypothetical protein
MERIVGAWPYLPAHIRDAIGTLVDASGYYHTVRIDSGRCSSAEVKAWQAAQQCRDIIQACLREEELQDAEEEFFRVIHAAFDA